MKKQWELIEIRQSHTYGGLLIGIPDDWKNAEIVAEALKEAKTISGKDSDPVLIPPKIVKRRIRSRGRLVMTPFLPFMECIGVFRSGDCFKASFITVVWFQDDDFTTHIKAGILERINSGQWDAQAYGNIVSAEDETKKKERRETSAARSRKKRIARSLPLIRDAAIQQGLATNENVNEVLYNMPVEKFKQLAKKWPDVSRVDFKPTI
jgi:hypothetical protein